CQGQGGSAAGQSSAYDQRAALAGRRLGSSQPGSAPGSSAGAGQGAAEHFPLAPVTLDLAHLEADRLQAAADLADAGEGGQGGRRGRQPGKLGVECRLPHVRVPGWSEPVQEPGIDPGIQLGQGIQDVADQQGQGDPSICQIEVLPAGRQVAVLGQQLVGPGSQLCPECQGTLQILAAEGIFFAADEMQPGIRRCQLVPELPGAEKVQAGTEAGFTDAESGSGGQGAPAPGQIIVL